MIAGLVRTGLATARHETVEAGGKAIRVKRYRGTPAGWRSKGGRRRSSFRRAKMHGSDAATHRSHRPVRGSRTPAGLRSKSCPIFVTDANALA